MSSLAPSWVEWTHWLYGVGQLKVGRGNWKAWARERLRLKRAAPYGKKMQLLARNGSSKLLLVMACVQGIELGDESRSVAWRMVVTLLSAIILVLGSVVLACAIGLFEFFMKEAERTFLLPLYSVGLCTLGYIVCATGLLRLETGAWHSPTALRGQRNVWYLMLASSAMQAWLVQIVGALPDRPPRSRFRWRRRWLAFKWRWLLVYAGFWQRMTDQVIALVIFGALLGLSILPISTLQTRILFNQSFTELIEKKIHRQNLLTKLYTPGFFHKAEADPAVEESGRRGSILGGRRGSLLGGARSKATDPVRSAVPHGDVANASTKTLTERKGSVKPVVEV